MALREAFLKKMESAFKEVKDKEAEELHNAIVEVIQEHQVSLQVSHLVLNLIDFELMNAKYKEIMGVVKLTDKPPVKKIGA